MNLQDSIKAVEEAIKLDSNLVNTRAAERLMEKVKDDQRKLVQVRGKALKEMRAIANLEPDERHSKADKILCEALEALGFNQVVILFESYEKWTA